MWTENNRALSEVNQILKQLNKNSLNKIPKQLLDEIEKNATENVDYIKANIPLEKLDLQEETKEILAVISYNYFCSPEEKSEWNIELAENERKFQEDLNKKYNPDNIFNKEDIQNNVENKINTEETSLIEYKETFFRKVWDKLKNFLNRK